MSGAFATRMVGGAVLAVLLASGVWALVPSERQIPQPIPVQHGDLMARMIVRGLGS